MNFTDASTFLSGGRSKSSRPIENNTRVERIDEDTIGIRLHGTYVVKMSRDGTYELNTGGWYTMTTKDRINSYAPVILGSDRGRWWLYRHSPDYWTKVGPFFDGVRVSQSGEILNARPQDDEARIEAETKALTAKIKKYVDQYIAAAEQQIYVDALYKEPEGAIDCWDCNLPTMAGRTTEDGDPKAHLLRHLDGPEFPPKLIYNAMRTKGAGSFYFQMLGGDEHMVQLQEKYRVTATLKRWLRDFLKSQLIEGVSGFKPFKDYSADRLEAMHR